MEDQKRSAGDYPSLLPNNSSIVHSYQNEERGDRNSSFPRIKDQDHDPRDLDSGQFRRKKWFYIFTYTMISLSVVYYISSLTGANFRTKENEMRVNIMSLSNKDERRTSSQKKKQKNAECKDTHYTQSHLKTAYEISFAALFQNRKGEKKFEASGIAKKKDDPFYYVVFDNSWAISKVGPNLTPFSAENILIGDPNREACDSEYEAIFEHKNIFYVLRESVKHAQKDGSEERTALCDDEEEEGKHFFHAIIEEIVLNDNDYEIKAQCRCQMEFDGKSKGFEGLAGLEGIDGALYVLGLCEGNHCSGKKGEKNDKGNGKVILMQKKEEGGQCFWETKKEIKIPKSADFKDYSDIAIHPDGKVVILSQEDSAAWIGKLEGVNDGQVDTENLEFDQTSGKVFYFPKLDSCHSPYCNVEGVAFIDDVDDDMIMVASDRMKGDGRQPHYCSEKDQSIHAFAIP